MRITRSHRKRLTLAATAFFGIILAAFFIGGWSAFRQARAIKAYSDIATVLSIVESEISALDVDELKLNPPQDMLPNAVAGHAEVNVIIFDQNGEDWDSIGSLATHLEDKSGSGVVNMESELVNYQSRLVFDQKDRPLNIIAAVNWANQQSNNRQLAIVLVVIWFPAVGLVAWLSWFAIGKTFEPLIAMANEAERLSGADLSQRLPPGRGEFRKLSDKLNSFLDRLQASITSEDQFIADAAHELRTPLTIMRGRFETTLLKDRSTDEYRKALQIGIEEAHRMSDLLEMLLDTARTHAQPVEPLEVSSVALDVIERWEPRFAARKTDLLANIDVCWCRVSQAELMSVLENLISNAYRYGQQGGDCSVEVAAASPWVQIRVSDRGSGISPENRERVFERFVRLEESRSRETGGFGIGLSVVQRIVKNRGGLIEISDREGGGTVFSVRLPITNPPQD